MPVIQRLTEEVFSRIAAGEVRLRALTEEKNWERLERSYRKMIARVKDGKPVLACVDTKEAAVRFIKAPVEKIGAQTASVIESTGGIAGVAAFIGCTLLLHRRLFDPRIRRSSSIGDIAVLVLIWLQLTLGIATTYWTIQHLDGSEMLRFMN